MCAGARAAAATLRLRLGLLHVANIYGFCLIYITSHLLDVLPER